MTRGERRDQNLAVAGIATRFHRGPCKKCGGTEFYQSNQCAKCARARTTARRLRNIDAKRKAPRAGGVAYYWTDAEMAFVAKRYLRATAKQMAEQFAAEFGYTRTVWGFYQLARRLRAQGTIPTKYEAMNELKRDPRMTEREQAEITAEEKRIARKPKPRPHFAPGLSLARLMAGR